MKGRVARAVVRQKHTWLMVGLVALAFALRAAGLDFQSLWRDEVDAIRFATRAWDQVFRMFVQPGQNGPLYYLTLRPWLRLAGESEYALRFFSVISGTLAVALVYRVARRLFPSLPVLALLAAALAATSPYLIWYGQEGKMYSLVLALVLISMDRYLSALDRGGWQRWLLYVAFTAIAVYVHLIAAFMIPVQIIAFFVMGSDKRKARWKGWLFSTGILLLPYVPLMRWQLPLLLSPADTGYRFVPLHDMLSSLLVSYSLGPISGSLRWTIVFFLVVLFAAAWLWRDHRSRLASLGILACWVLVPVMGLFLLTLVRPMYTARYLIFVLPAYLTLLAAGVVVIAGRSRLLAAVLLAALLGTNLLGVVRQSQTPLKADFRSATEYVESRRAPGDLLVFQIPYGRHAFNYYLPRYRQPNAQEAVDTPPWNAEYRLFVPLVAGTGAIPYRWAEGLYTNAGMDQNAVDAAMARLTAGTDTAWLVATEVDMWDRRGLVHAWLEQNASTTDQAHFVGVSIYRFDLP